MSNNDKNTRRGNGHGTLYRKNGSEIYMAQWSYNGKLFRKSTKEKNYYKALKVLDSYTKHTREDSEIKVFENIQNKIQSIKNDQQRDEYKKVGILICDIEEVYDKSLISKDITSSSKKQYLVYIRRFVNWMSEHYPKVKEMKEVSHKIAEEFLADIISDVGAGYFNNSLCLLRNIFRDFSKEAHIEENPFDDIKKMKNQKSMRSPLTIDEARRVLELAKTKTKYPLYDLLLIGAYTGIRIGDICNLKFENVDLVNKVISFIPQKTRKYQGVVRTPIANVIYDILSARFETREDGQEFLFPSLAKAYKSNCLTNHITRLFKEAGIKTSEIGPDGKRKNLRSFHSLRHWFCSENAKNGMNAFLVSSALGHRNIDMSRHYFHQNEGAMRQGINALPNLIDDSIKGDYIDLTISQESIEMLKTEFNKDQDKNINDTIKRIVESYRRNKNVIFV